MNYNFGFVIWKSNFKASMHAELQTPVSHGNIYKVNIGSMYWCFNCSHWALPYFEHFTEHRKVFQPAITWIQILSDCDPGSLPSKFIKLIAIQNRALIFRLLQVLMLMTAPMGVGLLEGKRPLYWRTESATQPGTRVIIRNTEHLWTALLWKILYIQLKVTTASY